MNGRRCNDWRIQVDALDIMGRHVYALADCQRARMYWGERLSLLQQHGWKPGIPGTLAHFALAAARMGDYAVAWASPAERAEWEAQVTQLRLKMSPDQFDAAWRRGEPMTLAEAAALTNEWYQVDRRRSPSPRLMT